MLRWKRSPTMRPRGVVPRLVALAFLALHLSAQQGPPLPDEMRARYGYHRFALELCPAADPALYGRFSLYGRFDTNKKEVTLDWFYLPPDMKPHIDQDERHPVSFEPTAMCVEADASDTFYVAGYVQQEGLTVVERWTLTDIALGTAMLPEGVTKATLSVNLRKEVLFEMPVSMVGPLRAMAYHKTQDRLWFMEEAAPYRLLSVNSEGEDLTVIADEITLPGLGQYKTMDASQVKTTAPDGGGFIIELFPWRHWKPLRGSKLQWSTKELLFRDADLDGVVDEIVEMTMQDRLDRAYVLHEEYPYQ